MLTIILIVLILVIFVIGIGIYNSLVVNKNQIDRFQDVFIAMAQERQNVLVKINNFNF